MASEEIVIDVAEEPRDPFEFLLSVTRRHGDAVRYSSGLGNTYLFNRPDYIKQVLHSPQFTRTSLVKIVLGEGLLASDGEYWKRQRRLAQPVFVPGRVAKFGPLILDHTQAMLERWADVAEHGQALDVSGEMTRLTLSIIVEALFGVDLGPKAAELCESIQVLMEDLGDMGCTQINSTLTFSPSSGQRFHTALASVDRIAYEIIDEGRDSPLDPGNLLSLLLSARDEETSEPLSTRQLRDEVVTLMISGHETTSLILSWAWTLLAWNPEAERRVHQELDDVLGKRVPTLQDLDSLPYSHMVLQESMRLYPPVWFIARKSVFAGEVGGCHVPENVLVIVSPYAINRHPRYWEDPDEFEPLRFSPGLDRPRYSYIPFGGGRHVCLGTHLAMMEGQLILASIAQNYRVHPVPDHPIEPQPAITLRQRHGLMATLSRRTVG